MQTMIAIVAAVRFLRIIKITIGFRPLPSINRNRLGLVLFRSL
jgi:hypothetical protein